MLLLAGALKFDTASPFDNEFGIIHGGFQDVMIQLKHEAFHGRKRRVD
jgi:hypothetical protein